ncbi:PQQ-dependent sugar dehydrogenase [Geodermatophilus sp. URMC 64]
MRTLFALVGAVVVLAGCTAGSDSGDPAAAGTTSAQPPPTSAPPTAPALDVAVVADGLDHPWDVAQAPDGTLLFDERGGGFTALLPDGTVQEVTADFDDLFARGETGLMGLVLDPAFADNRRFYTCQGRQGETPDIAVIAWTVDDGWRSATRVADPLLGGIPVNGSSGRHGGCRLRFDPTGALLVSTGDNARGSNPQDRDTLAGKVLRIDAATGRPAAGNPFPGGGAEGFLWTFGHRNVQGLAVRPGTDQVYAVEQGTTRDDEVNLLQPGANYGYDPNGADGSYDESVPMTDPEIPGAVPAVWSSGSETIATCGGTFLDGEQWSAYDGLLLVAVLKGEGVLALRLAGDGALQEQFRLPEFEGTHGRIRTVQLGTDGDLYVTTDNGDDDQVLRVTPRG